MSRETWDALRRRERELWPAVRKWFGYDVQNYGYPETAVETRPLTSRRKTGNEC